MPPKTPHHTIFSLITALLIISGLLYGLFNGFTPISLIILTLLIAVTFTLSKTPAPGKKKPPRQRTIQRKKVRVWRVSDLLTKKELGEMAPSIGVAFGVLASPTIVPEGFKYAGLTLVFLTILIMYFAIFALIHVKGHTQDAIEQAFLHIITAITVAATSTFIAGLLYGLFPGKTFMELFNTPLSVAFSSSLSVAAVIDGIIGDRK